MTMIQPEFVPCPDCGETFTTRSLPDHRCATLMRQADPVNHPQHYRWLPGDIEVIDITEHMSFPLGNVVKYVLRADHKGKPLEDLKKARWYLDREIARREAGTH